MKRPLAAALVLGLATIGILPRPSLAAMEVAVSLSPATAIVGHPVEVLVRTFVPIDGNAVDLSPPSMGYPAPSGQWNVLYPVDDYPFDVIARSPKGEEQNVALARDPSDASLWRGSFTPTTSGKWSIVMRNFPSYAPIELDVAADSSASAPWIAIAASLGGLAGGLLIGRFIRRPRHLQRP